MHTECFVEMFAQYMLQYSYGTTSLEFLFSVVESAAF